MPIDPRLLTLTQWLSPAYPTGAFVWSHGLEQAVAERWVRDGNSLYDWLFDVLCDGSGRGEAIWIARAFEAEGDEALCAIDAEARAFAPSRERLREAERQGAAFARVTREVWELDLPDLLMPVALGRAAKLVDLPLDTTITLYLQSFCCNLVSAAQRLMPLGQTEAQAVLARLSPICGQTAEEARGGALWSNAFLSDIAAMKHETLEPRLFQS
ncbi:urease accessory protein UreF [Primorskyibacter aestuariivivens]|uniref:urease accessory protein UreF n=1 Tax=Primorskyibacter aestuariivivens TaxID=1888912 RepID=UPI002300DF86|nr:urease accessory UreF family protein [Primorskyibacter aestuariivivens]MDA7427999.1 urease accessory protein UreF [Primorskyibacter aestuariivivens]